MEVATNVRNAYLIKGLHKYFGKNEVLKGIDLDIKSGEVVVIIGPQGQENQHFFVQ